ICYSVGYLGGTFLGTKGLDKITKGVKGLISGGKGATSNSLDDIGRYGLNSLDDIIEKAGIQSVDDLTRIGVTSAEDLAKLGVNSVDDLAKLGINNIDELSKLGISRKDLSRVGIKGISEAETGGKLLSVDEYLRREEEAEKMYNTIRNYKTDVKKISQNTGMPEWRVRRIKEHVFNNDHILSDGVRRFDPNYDMANAWERLIKGEHVQSDIDLLNHEIFESKVESIFETNYRTAHDKTESTGRIWKP
ncbi:hypothetical protein ACTQ4P_18470, partial [Clostridium sporogenes]